jgi:trk system potassium uptake protein TrkA
MSPIPLKLKTTNRRNSRLEKEEKMNVIVVGCGRVGIELAHTLHKEHTVTVIDKNARAFDQLGLDFLGRTTQGDALDRKALQRAGVETAEALAAVTSSDNVNAIVARIARDVFHVGQVVARVYKPSRSPIYGKLNLQTVSSSSWAAQRIKQMMTHPGLTSLSITAEEEVQYYEMRVPAKWAGRRLSEFLPEGNAVPAILLRNGRSLLPSLATEAEEGDVLQLSTTREGADTLRGAVHADEKGKE